MSTETKGRIKRTMIAIAWAAASILIPDIIGGLINMQNVTSLERYGVGVAVTLIIVMLVIIFIAITVKIIDYIKHGD